MVRRQLYVLTCVAASALGGCLGEIADDGWRPRRPLGKDYATFRPPVQPAAASRPAPPSEPEGTVTLRVALAAAMLRSPELAGVAWEVRMAEARALQASLPPNPEIGFDLETFGSLRAAETTLQLGQVIFLSDKLQRQRQAALLERDLAGWDYEAKRIAVLTDTTKAFVALVAAQQKAALAEELVGVSGKLLDLAGERVRSGKTSPLEEMKAKVELATVRMAREAARQGEQAARQRLAAFWGATEARFARAEGSPEALPAVPTREQLAALVAQNPGVARWATEMQRRQAVARLEKAKAIPDLNVGAGLKREGGGGGGGGWGTGVSIALPVFDRNQGGIRESHYAMAKVQVDRRASQARVHSELAEAYQALATAHARVGMLRQDILPEARKAFEAAMEGYRQGKFAYLDVQDAQRTLFDARSGYVDALADYHGAAANVEGLVGQSLESITTTNKKQEKQP